MDLFSNEIISKLTNEIIEHLKTIVQLKADNKALCERIVKLEEEIEKQRTTAREYEQRWLTSMGYYGVK